MVPASLYYWDGCEMVEQAIGFCVTADGVRIAYATLGDGPPLVYACGWPTHLQLEWEKPAVRRFIEGLARSFTLIRYDMRCSGLSDRNVSDFSLSGLVKDLEAVVDHLCLGRFPLLSLGDLAGPIAITYAAAHPERVSHLILNGAFARGGDIVPPEQQQTMLDFVASFGFPIFEFTDASGIDVQGQRELREIYEAAAEASVHAALLNLIFAVDVGGLLERVSAPALVLHARHDPWAPFSLGRAVAACLPNARFVPFEGGSSSPIAHSEVLIREIRRFLLIPDADALAGVRPGGLTPREVEVLRLLALGMSSREVAERLVLSVRTVERHTTNVYLKLGIHTRAEATAYAMEQGLLSTRHKSDLATQ